MGCCRGLVAAGSMGLVLVCGGVAGGQEAGAGKGDVTRQDVKPTTRAAAARPAVEFVPKTIAVPDGSQRKYALFVPAAYEADKARRWPVIVFLHGSGECGKDGIRQTKVGLGRYIAKHAKTFPFICVMPQAQTRWFKEVDEAAVWAILETVHRAYRTDRDRVYLTGLSMGGYATWEFAMAHPDAFAAIVPVCGVGPEAFASNIVHLPVWAFHGAKDKHVPVKGSRVPIGALKRLGAAPKYTEYPDLGHACWDRAYATEALWPWLLEQQRGRPPRVIDYRFFGGATTIWWLGVQGERGRKEPARIRAEIGAGGRVTIRSEGVAGWGIKSEEYPLKIGQRIKVTWNGDPVYEGEFNGGMLVRPETPGEAAKPEP